MKFTRPAAWPWHTLGFAIYPALALLANNITQVKPGAALRAVIVVVIAEMALWAFVALLLRDLRRAALLCSFGSLLFFSYGHLYGYLERNPVFGLALGRHRFLAPLWVALAVLGGWWLIRRLKDTAQFTQSLNVISLVMLLLPAAQIGWYAWRTTQAQAISASLPAELAALRPPQDRLPPDIYYIILDGYARGDVLLNTMRYDDTSFLDGLRQDGFYIADCSRSNYAQTEFSLASALNLDYLEAFVELDPITGDRAALRNHMRQSAVRRTLERMGYTTIAFETGFLFSQFEDAGVYLSPGTSRVGGMNGFELLLLKTSLGLVLTDGARVLPGLLNLDQTSPARQRRAQILYTLQALPQVSRSIPSPKFVFAHIVAPHTPIVLGPHGEEIVFLEFADQGSYFQAYTDEVRYLNDQIARVVETILQNSAAPPVIILQADHGHDMASAEERMAILNAYYLPDGGEARLYPSITPVNTFRVIFNHYFNGQFDLLPDRSFFSNYTSPYEFMEINGSSSDCR